MTNRPPVRALLAVPTAPLWSDELGAKTFALTGRVFARANLDVLTEPRRC